MKAACRDLCVCVCVCSVLCASAVFACNATAQTQLLRSTAAFESAAFVTTHWLWSLRPTAGPLYAAAEELRSQVKRMGAFFQLLIQVGNRTALH